jgi:hypothetical protein
MRLLATALLVAVFPLNAADSLIGTWQLNIEKSEFFDKDPRYKRHVFTLEIVGRQLRYQEVAVFSDDRRFEAEFTVSPKGTAIKPKTPTTFTPRGGAVSFEVAGDDMLWVMVTEKSGKVVARWMMVLDGPQVKIVQVTGGSSTRVYDRVSASN